jgi:hypothetical protein
MDRMTQNSFSQFIFICRYQLRIGTKSVFEFHNNRSVLFHGIWKLKKSIWNYFMSMYISNFRRYMYKLKKNIFYKYLISILFYLMYICLGSGLILWHNYEWFQSETRIMKDRTCWSNLTSTTCHNEKNKLFFQLWKTKNKIKWRLNICCNMLLVSLFVPQCCLHSTHTTESPFTFNTLDKSVFEFHNYRSVLFHGFFFFSCEKQKLKIKWRLNICKI